MFGDGDIEQGDAVSGGNGNAAIGVRTQGGERPASRLRYVERARTDQPDAAAHRNLYRRASRAIRPPRATDAAAQLERALIAQAQRDGTVIEVVRTTATRWASATFTGARHVLELIATPADAASRWVAGLPDADLPLHGHLVADVGVVETVREGERLSVRVEALTVEER